MMLRKIVTRDAIYRCHIGNLRIACVIANKSIEEAATRWKTPITSLASQHWGEYMAGTVMLSSFFKGEERVKMTLETSNLSSNNKIHIEAMAAGEVRGKIGSIINLKDNGRMHIDKILYGAKQPHRTVIEATGHAEIDWQRFYNLSEQTPTIVKIQTTAPSISAHCCGLVIQQMPKHSKKQLKEPTYKLDDLTFPNDEDGIRSSLKWNTNGDILKYLNAIIPEANLTDQQCRRIPLDYFCRCSATKFTAQLQGLSTDHLEEIIHGAPKEGLDVTCEFCNQSYHYPLADLEKLLQK